MAIEYPPAQEKLVENARIAADLLKIAICISIIFGLQTVPHPTMIEIRGKMPKLRSDTISISKTSESYDQQ